MTKHENMPQSERWVRNCQRQRAAGVLCVLGWVFWLPLWVPTLLVATFVVWVILHHRLEAGLGDVLLRRWQRTWPPGPVVLIALLVASGLAFVLLDAPATAKIVPVGLDVLALSLILFGQWWTLVALPAWLGGPQEPRSAGRGGTPVGSPTGAVSRPAHRAD